MKYEIVLNINTTLNLFANRFFLILFILYIYLHRDNKSDANCKEAETIVLDLQPISLHHDNVGQFSPIQDTILKLRLKED